MDGIRRDRSRILSMPFRNGRIQSYILIHNELEARILIRFPQAKSLGIEKCIYNSDIKDVKGDSINGHGILRKRRGSFEAKPAI